MSFVAENRSIWIQSDAGLSFLNSKWRTFVKEMKQVKGKLILKLILNRRMRYLGWWWETKGCYSTLGVSTKMIHTKVFATGNVVRWMILVVGAEYYCMVGFASTTVLVHYDTINHFVQFGHQSRFHFTKLRFRGTYFGSVPSTYRTLVR